MNKCVIAAVAAGLFTLARAEADTIIVNNLTSSASFNVSGLKNGLNDSPYAQGFKPTLTGNLDSLVMDLGLQSTNGSSSGSPYLSNETMSIYLYTANSSGTPITELAALATGITANNIDNPANYLGYTQNNDSFVFQYSLTSSLLSHPALTANSYYAIEMSLSAGGPQDIGWAEENGSDSVPAGEVGKLQPPGGYGRMELDMSVPEPSSWALGFIAIALFGVLRVRSTRA